ncbi:unnamed protein product [Trichogramma brassicae]|uniref:Uncharacterized protein n=1 Tax=Trichogramma brassicae TaxID=86971 RepID=A0A6H5ICF1_9HYME|nr:unnamed protein product [Trichogramma brassicae]
MPVERVPIATKNKEMWPIKELAVRLRIADDSFVSSQPCDKSDDNGGCHDDEPVRSRWSYEESERTVQFRNSEKLDQLKSLRKNVDWTNEKKRHQFFQAFYLFVIRTWRGEIPDTTNLKSFWKRRDVQYFPHYVNDFLQKELIDWLLLDCVEKRHRSDTHFHLSNVLISFVASGAEYKDTPELDENGQPLLLRTTALHRAARIKHYCIVEVLFEIYNKFNVNYTDESGLSHFHVACMFGCVEVVEKFLRLGQDPNVIWQVTGDTPLHMALKNRHMQVSLLLLQWKANPNLVNNNGWTSVHIVCLGSQDNFEWLTMIRKESFQEYHPLRLSDSDKWGETPLHLALGRNLQVTAELLLRYGADPNAIGANGSTPLHIICKIVGEKLCEDKFLDLFFKIVVDDKNQRVNLDHWDVMSRTPLELAVAYHLPHAVQLLLDRGADFSVFVFPDKIDLVNRFFGEPNEILGYLRVASSYLVVIDILKTKGYRVLQHHAWKIKKVFEKTFKLAKFVENWYDDVEFVEEAGDIMITRCLSLYNLVRLHPKEAAILVKYRDYYNFMHSSMVLQWPSERYRDSCFLHLSQIMWEKFSVYGDP